MKDRNPKTHPAVSDTLIHPETARRLTVKSIAGNRLTVERAGVVGNVGYMSLSEWQNWAREAVVYENADLLPFPEPQAGVVRRPR
jgi:hypothetical protein